MSTSKSKAFTSLASKTEDADLLAAASSITEGGANAVEEPVSRGPVRKSPPASPKSHQKYVDHSYTDYAGVDEDDLRLMKDTTGSCVGGVSGANETKRLLGMSCSYGPMKSKGHGGSVMMPFPGKLLEVLDRGDLAPIIDWMPHGRAFIVKRPEVFASQILPRFFKQTKFLSFTRQLNLWGMKRITRGLDAGAYYHELFLPARPNLAMRMKRQKTKGTGIRPMPNPEAEPNFYHDYPRVERKPKTHLMPLPPLPSERMASLHQHSASHRFMPPMTSSMAAGQSFMSRMTASDSSIGASHQALSTPSFMPPMTASASSMGSQSFMPSMTARDSSRVHSFLSPMTSSSSSRVSLNMTDPVLSSRFHGKNDLSATNSAELRLQGLMNQRSLSNSKANFASLLDDIKEADKRASLDRSNNASLSEQSSATSRKHYLERIRDRRSLHLRQRVDDPSAPSAPRSFHPSSEDAHGGLDEISSANRRLIERLLDRTASNAFAQQRPSIGDTPSANSLLDRSVNEAVLSVPGRNFAPAQRRTSFRDVPTGGGPLHRPLGRTTDGVAATQIISPRTSLKAPEPFGSYGSRLLGIPSRSLPTATPTLPARTNQDLKLGLSTGSRQEVNVESVAKALREAQQLEEIAKTQRASAQALAGALRHQHQQRLGSAEYDALKYLSERQFNNGPGKGKY